MFRSKIDPANLSPKSEKLLAALLEANPEQKIFKAGTYEVSAPTAKNPLAAKKVVLKKTLVSYPSKKAHADERLAVCDKNPISEQHASKYFSAATVKVSKGANGAVRVSSKSKARKERFIKLTNTADETVKEAIVRENAFLKEMSLFGAKALTTDGDWSAQVMRRIEGRSMIDILIEDSEKNMFTEDQRLDLWIMAGEAIMQAHARGIIHRDVKADQFIVKLDKDNNPLQVVLGDYDRAKWKDEVVYEQVGTSQPIDYRAPEVKDNQWSDEKSDAFSFSTLLIEYGWDCLFSSSKYKGIADEHKLCMEQIMLGGIEEDAQKRASVNNIVKVFKAIRDSRKNEKSKPRTLAVG